MGLSKFLGNAVDGAIGVFSPKAALHRKFYRNRLSGKRASAKYAAAKTDRLTGAWAPVDSNVNAIISASSSMVRARVRQLVRDFPYFSRAVDVLVDNTVGSGIMFQSRIQTSDGKLDKQKIQQVEDAFNFWADEADFAGKLHYYEIMELCKRQDLECGEFIAIRRNTRLKGRYIPFALQLIEADWLTDRGVQKVGRGNEIDQGIEFNTVTGEIVAYHFTDPDTWGKTTRAKADVVLHGFKTYRPGQLRGISPFSPAVLVTHDLHDYLESEIDAAKMAAKYLAFVTKQEGVNTGLLDGETGTADEGKKLDEMENAIIEYLQTGEGIEIATNPRPGTNFAPFVKLMLTMISATVGVPYELLSMDYSKMNYSTGRTSRNDFSHFLRPISVRHVRYGFFGGHWQAGCSGIF
jgi:lambda family phage portal protein